MPFQGLKATSALNLVHFRSVDEFQSAKQLGNAHNIPLSGHCDSARADLALPSCRLIVQRTFPRILEAHYRTEGKLLFMPLADSIDARVNGMQVDAQSIMTICGTPVCQVFEPSANLFAIIDLDPAVSDRAGPAADDCTQLLRSENPAAMQSFRVVTREILAFASSTESPTATMLRHVEETLLAALDAVMAPIAPTALPGHFQRYLTIVWRVEDYLAANPSSNIYGADLVRACDVPLRTLQTATRAVRGMSVHRYLRLRRLWSVRRTLSLGRPNTKISDVARANGFWHMGEFATAYRTTFGETASTTLARNS
jgi:AraC family ethanolamine operon transcriptional activator